MNLAHSRAPGRVELLGNHTDYNEGVVLSAAIHYAVTAAGEVRDHASVDLRSDFYPEPTTASLEGILPRTGPAAWANYPLGVIDTVYRRAAHITGEDERVFAGVEMLRRGDKAGFGALMFASHESSRFNFENSTPDLDTLVALARELPGVLGSRLTGGGFGGATVSLVERRQAEAVATELDRRYTERTGHRGKAILCESADGAA